MKLLDAELSLNTEEVSSALTDVVEAAKNIPDSVDEIGGYLSNLYSVLAEYAVSYGGRIVAAVLILIIGFRLIKVITRRVSKAKAFSKVDSSARSFFFKTLVIIEKIIIVVLAASVLGVPMASVVTIIGSCGLAIGLALQGSLGNIAGGFVLMVTKPFTVGDFIIIGGGEGGTVVEIGVFYTTIVTPDNRRIVYPNSTISAATLINVSGEKTRRVDLQFTVAYDADIDKVKALLKNLAYRHELVLDDPEPFVRLSAHGDSALEFTVRAWCKTEDYWKVHFDLLEEAKKAFDENGIEIPYPQMDVHVVPTAEPVNNEAPATVRG